MKSSSMKKRNFNIFLLSNSLMALAVGLFGPFYYVFINDMGGSIENFGIATGLLVLSGALFSLFSGKLSDKIGRKPFLVAGGLASVVIVLLYTQINSLWQLYALQVFYGIVSAGFETAEGAYLGDLTEKSKRGEQVGKYDALLGISEALAIIAGGFLVGIFGFKIVFYFVAFVCFVSTLVMMRLKEK